MKLFAILYLFLSVLSYASTQDELVLASFDDANKQYAKGAYEDAIVSYSNLISLGQQSASLHYNLANAYFQVGEFGPAILHYKKSLALEPSQADAKANLRLCYEKAELIEVPEESLLGLYAQVMSLSSWILVANVSFWVFLFSILLPRYFSGGNVLTSLASIFSVLALVLTLPALVQYHIASAELVVLESDTPLRVAPASGSPTSVFLQAGAMLTKKEQRNQFVYVSSESGKAGWLKEGEYQSVWEK